MDIQTLTEFLGWMTLINLGFLLLVSAVFSLAMNPLYALISKFFPMSKETFSALSYLQLQIFKILWGIFNLVPFIALMIVS